MHFSGDHFRLVVQTIDRAQHNLACGEEPVEQRSPVGAQHASHFPHRHQFRTRGPLAPLVEEESNPVSTGVASEPLEILLEQAGPHRAQVQGQQLPQLDRLCLRQMFRTFQQAPTNAGENRLLAGHLEPLGFSGADLINRLLTWNMTWNRSSTFSACPTTSAKIRRYGRIPVPTGRTWNKPDGSLGGSKSQRQGSCASADLVSESRCTQNRGTTAPDSG